MLLHLARALVLLIAACVAPSLANAHAGHAHSAPTAHSTPMTANVAAPAGRPDTAPAGAIVIRTEVFSATPAPPDSLPSGCNSHCCNGMAGMTCCTAALAADVSTAPISLSSYAFLFLHAPALLGLVPEALPKPPKSFA